MTDPKNRYGFMREVEADLVDRLLDKINVQFREIRFLEIGVFGGGTVSGIVRWCREGIGCPVFASGVDFAQWKPSPPPLDDYDFHDCDSMDAFREIKHKYNFLFVDGCHCVNHSMMDFLNYSPFVVVGGYALFHDTALPTSLGKQEQEQWPQDHSYAGKPTSVLGVREGLKKLGLIQNYRSDWKFIEEIPSEGGLMGMCLFQKLLEL
jgi:Methyltransferase domain